MWVNTGKSVLIHRLYSIIIKWHNETTHEHDESNHKKNKNIFYYTPVKNNKHIA